MSGDAVDANIRIDALETHSGAWIGRMAWNEVLSTKDVPADMPGIRVPPIL